LYKKVIAGEQYFTDDIAVLAEMPSGGFHPQVVQAMEPTVAIMLDDGITDVVEPKHDVPCGDDLIGPFVGQHVPEQAHQGSFAAAHRSREQEPFIGVDPEFVTDTPIPDKVGAELKEGLPVFLVDLKVPAEQEFPFGIEVNEHLVKVVLDTVPFK